LIAIRHDKDEDGDDDNGDDEIADSAESESDNHDEGHERDREADRDSHSRRNKQGRANARKGNPFIQAEAVVEGNRHGADAQEHEEERAVEGERSLDDTETAGSSQSFYRSVDQASRQHDAESKEPYFPLPFAVADDRPMEFNFDMFFLDSLVLPRHIEPRDSWVEMPASEVEFNDAASAIRYCTQRLESRWKAVRQPTRGFDSKTLTWGHRQVEAL